MSTATTKAPKQRRWSGLVVGLLVGAADYSLLIVLGADMRLGETDITWIVLESFLLAAGALGYAVGRILEERARAEAAAQMIARQMLDLERVQARMLQQEKLAALGQLAAGVAHEVRNPLGVIRSSASLLQEPETSALDRDRAAEFIVSEVDRLNTLITRLLEFAGPARPRTTATPISVLIDQALSRAAPTLKEHAVKIARDSADATVLADPELIAQAIYGLLINAVEANGDGGTIRLSIRAATNGAPDDAGFATLEVHDDGPGIDREAGARIMEPFFTTKPRGTGLGLPMAAKILEAHGGRLECDLDGPGATFRLVLPAAPASRP